MTPPDTHETAYPIFSEQRLLTDARVTPVMTHCLGCGAELPDAQTTGEGTAGKGMLLFTQCQTDSCKRAYVLDFASFAM